MRTATFPGVSPIFVVGAPRSGTTLLARILDGHPRLAIADELIYFDILLEARSVVPELDTAERIERFFQLLPRMDHVRYWRGFDEVLAEVKRRLLDTPAPSYPLLYLLLMQVYAERRGAVRFGEKTPWNVRHLDEIVALFPDARIVHLVRDPRAQVASRRKLPRSSRDVVSHALKWRLDLAAAAQFVRGPRATRENYTELRYEDLVTDAEPRVRRLCDFLGESFDPGMMAFHRDRDAMFRDQPWKEGVFRPVHVESLDAWRDELSPSRARIIELVCGPEMRRHGYAADSGGSLVGAAARLPAEAMDWLRFKRDDAARRRAGAPSPRSSSRTAAHPSTDSSSTCCGAGGAGAADDGAGGIPRRVPGVPCGRPCRRVSGEGRFELTSWPARSRSADRRATGPAPRFVAGRPTVGTS